MPPPTDAVRPCSTAAQNLSRLPLTPNKVATYPALSSHARRVATDNSRPDTHHQTATGKAPLCGVSTNADPAPCRLLHALCSAPC
ncbi:hypothetical protein SVAN01_09346 [Stagonosporopsis vannaccii]|nr:hypothetical protein SVAN01_09346 [Stagonosporopsis vannaccii]